MDRILVLLTVFAKFLIKRGNYYGAILRKQTFSSQKDKTFNCERMDTSARRLLREPAYETKRHCLASRALNEYLMSLEDFGIKYDVQTKNITKNVPFKLKHL